MTAATLAASRLAAEESNAGDTPREVDGVHFQKAPCRFCGTGCHVQVGVKGGKVVAIQGDAKAEVNKGLLCMKGYHVGLALYGKDRLTKPLLRKNGKLVPISWKEAIDTIAERIQADPKGFAMYGSGQWTIPEGYAANKLVKGGLGSNHVDPNARLCMASAVTGFLSTYGVDEPAGCYDDLDNCDVLITWGNNPAEMHPVLFSRVMDRRSRGERVKLIDIGTRRTRTTEFADEYLEFKPHTDLAVANGIAQQLIERGEWDREFVEKNCAFREQDEPATLNGKAMDFEAYKAAIAHYTPEKVAEISGVPAEKIRMLADLFASKDLKITSLWCMGMNQHTRGTAINNLVHGVHLLSGHFGRPGDAPTSLTGQPSACGTVREVGTLAHALPGGRVVTNADHRKQAEDIWNVPAGRIPEKPGYHTVEMWKRFSTPKDTGGDISTIWVQVTNPGQTLPNLNQLFFPSRKIPGKFLIVSDVYPTATTEHADLVLPSALWVEKNGVFGNSERRTQQWFRMVKPPGEARDDCWQLIAVAHRLLELGNEGMKDRDGKFIFHVEKDGKAVPIWDFAHYYDVNVDQHLFEEYRKFTRLKHKDLAPYEEYTKARGLRWPVVQQKDGSWRETKFRFASFDDPYADKSRPIDFYHSTTHDHRAQIWFRPYEPPPESPDKEFPFWLCTGRVIEHWHSGTLTMRIPQLRRSMPGSYIEMHPDDAARLRIANGEKVLVESRRGKLELSAWLNGRGRPPRGSTFIPFFDETLLANLLTLEDYDPFSKQPDYKKCAVRIRKIG
ncbi:MAG: molybdopterin-dependent oxidoreductase [Myxococcales bacterium]|nr:molybdopterin-dependent oxidoreductase [Myxococcales bacterium]